MEYRLNREPQGWVITRHSGPDDESGQVVGGPFSQRDKAVAYIQERARQAERTEQQAGEEARARALSDDELVDALNAAIENPPPAPRGRPVPDNSTEADIAIEYYWRLRKHKRKRGNPTRIVAALAKLYDRTADHVRKVRAEYAPVANYDERLLKHLRAEALQRRSHKPESKPLPATPDKLELVKQWLTGLLKTHGPMLAESVFQRARVAGFSHRTVERAAHSLGIEKVGRGRATSWKLPPKKPAKRPI